MKKLKYLIVAIFIPCVLILSACGSVVGKWEFDKVSFNDGTNTYNFTADEIMEYDSEEYQSIDNPTAEQTAEFISYQVASTFAYMTFEFKEDKTATIGIEEGEEITYETGVWSEDGSKVLLKDSADSEEEMEMTFENGILQFTDSETTEGQTQTVKVFFKKA